MRLIGLYNGKWRDIVVKLVNDKENQMTSKVTILTTTKYQLIALYDGIT